MKRLATLPHAASCIAVLCALAWTGCAQKLDEGKIPITTASEEARKEFLLGRELAEKLLLTNAIEHFDKAIVLDPGFAQAYLSRANVATTANEFFAHLKQAVALAGKASEGERLLIFATESGTNAEAMKQKEYLTTLVAKYPKDERAHFNLGGYYFGQQDYARAIEHYTKAIELAPDYSPAYNILGYAYRQVEHYTDAEKVFRKYTELIPNDPNPYDSYAELLMKMGRFDESISYYQRALAIDQYFIASRIGIATNSMYKGMHDEGAAELRKLSGLARNEGEQRQGRFTQTVLLADAGRLDDAVAEMRIQFAMAEKLGDAGLMSADLGVQGNILLEMERFDEAVATYERSLKLIVEADFSQEIKENARLIHYYNLAAAALGKKDMQTANTEAGEFRRGAEASNNPNQIRQAHELMGMIALAAKDYDNAIAELQQSSQQNPYNLYRQAVAYQGKGNRTKAREFFVKAAHFNGLPALNYAFIRTKAEKMLTGA